ncbi:hypothetical protein CLOM_g11952 [Closterium sp. NIES-68]|nr:hypothetical protein CLOM_g11952 [Closterium sp. NIES-68]
MPRWLEYLGHVISTKGVEVNPRKIATLQAWLPPTNLQELRRFLGFVNYVRRFIPNMAGVMVPLTDLLRKGTKCMWGEKEQAAFSTLKFFSAQPLTFSSPILTVRPKSSQTPATSPLAQYCYRTSAKVYNQSRTSHGSYTCPSEIIQYMTRRCLRSCTPSRCGGAT